MIINTSDDNKKHILLGVCGGIAAYKAAELVRLLRKHHAEVRVVMTESAQEFINPLTFSALSGNFVYSRLFAKDSENAMDHINLARWADVLLVAPASANFMAKCSHGLADDLLSTIYLVANCPVYFAPAMNQAMWNKSVTQENLTRLKAEGVTVIGPETGDQACGETGFGRMTEPEVISTHIFSGQTAQYLQGINILISAGATQESLDPVRYLTNRSSGKMGYALARAAQKAGARVTLVTGVTNLVEPDNVCLIKVITAAQMYEAILSRAHENAIYIGAAAVADYTPVTVDAQKLKKDASQITLTLEKTKDILASVAALENKPFTVGFAAETHDLETHAISKMRQKNIDMIAANLVGQKQGGFDSDDNELLVFWENGLETLKMANKNRIAEQLLTLIIKRFNEKNSA